MYILDLTTRTVTGQVNVGAFPASMAVTPDGTQVWIPCRGDSNLFVIDTLTNASVGFLQGLTFPTGIAINPTGTTVYVAEAPLVGNGTIAVIDPSTFTVRSRIPVGSLPHVVAITPTGRHLFVTNALSNSITQINTATNRVMRSIPMPGRARRPLGITFVH